MFALKLTLATVLAVATARNILLEDQRDLQGYEDEKHPAFEPKDPFTVWFKSLNTEYRARIRRQAGNATLNSNVDMGIVAKDPQIGNDKLKLSNVGPLDLNSQVQQYFAREEFEHDNIKEQGLSVVRQTIPGFGEILSTAGKGNVFHNDNHDVSAQASITNNLPVFRSALDFNTYGGGLDYTFKNKVGASVGMGITPLLNRNEYSTMGKLNVFRDPSSSIDLSGGFTKFQTPSMSSWRPNFGITFTRSF